jgi:hypothetical protein
MTVMKLLQVNPGEPGYIEPATRKEQLWDSSVRECESRLELAYEALVCTRARGHNGDHAAHDHNDVMLAAWP